MQTRIESKTRNGYKRDVASCNLKSHLGRLLCLLFGASCFTPFLTAAVISPPIVNPTNGHTYILLEKSNWTDAEAEAISLGGHLATIRNQDEQDWVFATFSHYGGVNRLLWIGLSDVGAEGEFSWANGEPWTFADWRDGEPNNASGNEHYVALFDPTHDSAGQWNDWSNRVNSPLGKPMNGVVEVIPTLAHLPTIAPYSFTTIIGSPGVRGFIDGTNNGARLSGVGITSDASGNLYFTDTSNNSIRQVIREGTNWVVLTLAGSTNSGFADGVGTNAVFEDPWDIAIDSATNIYVAGRGDQTIRKIVLQGTNGVVSTLAGTPDVPGYVNATGTAAKFHNPNGVAVDKEGSVYVGDSVNNRIRKVTADGVVTTVAGSTLGYADGVGAGARFYYPHGLKVDKAGNIYVADTYNHLIRKIVPIGAEWHVSTIAGNYQTNSSGEPQGGFADGTKSTAQFNRPYNIALDDYGNIFVSDCYSNACIRKITPVGTNWVVTTIGGVAGGRGLADGTGNRARFNGLYDGVTVDAKGNLFVLDQATIRIGTPTPQITREGERLTVYWPASGYRAERAPDLSPDTIWSSLTNFTLIDNMFYVTNAGAGNEVGFFRLR